MMVWIQKSCKILRIQMLPIVRRRVRNTEDISPIVVEVADDNHNSITVDYQYEKNTYSDSQFLKTILSNSRRMEHMPYSQQMADTAEWKTASLRKIRT